MGKEFMSGGEAWNKVVSPLNFKIFLVFPNSVSLKSLGNSRDNSYRKPFRTRFQVLFYW